jgi:outer membrane protein assembly factor BamE (lipoprotein component of BamABCDE complex)
MPLKRALNTAASAVVALLLASCASANLGRDFSTEQIGSLRVGETTKAEVLQKFGAPLVSIVVADWKCRRVHFGDEQTTHIWRYLFGHGNLLGSSGKSLQVEFDASGRVIDYVVDRSLAEAAARNEKARNFDLFKARDQIIPGKTPKADVLTLLGTNCVSEAFNQPLIAERIRYSHTQPAQEEWVYDFGVKARKIYGKSLNLLIDSEGRVLAVKGESDFVEDLNRQQMEKAR